MTAIGNLSEKGISFFLDRSLKYELVQNAIVNMKSSDSIEFFISSRYSAGTEYRIGKIFILEEEYRAFLIDLVKESNGHIFRSYDAVESLSLDVEFDAYRFVRNLLLSVKNYQFFNVLELLTRGIVASANGYKTCVYGDTNRIIECSRQKKREIFEPNGGWDSIGEYNFFRDFFLTEKDGQDSLWNQWRGNSEVLNAITRYYIDHGFEKRPENALFNGSYNYYNNIYPEQTELLDYRWHENGYSISQHEIKVNKTFIYKTFRDWYNGSASDLEVPLIPILDSNDDWGGELWSSSNCCNDDIYMLYDGVVSTSPGQNEFVVNGARNGYVGIGFLYPVIMSKLTVNVGNHQYSGSDAPSYVSIYARNENTGWVKLASCPGQCVPIDGRVKTIELPAENAYRYYEFRWQSTRSWGWSRISNMQWYAAPAQESNFEYYADEKTVKYFTDIAKTELQNIFKRDEHILIDLLGPLECVRVNSDNECVKYAYGGEASSPSPGTPWDMPSPEDIIATALPGDWPENSFLVVKPSMFANVSFKLATSDAFRETVYSVGLTAEDAFYSVFYFNGVVGGQHVYNNAIGNEYRYAMPFKSFLDEQGWTIDDFMDIYSDHIDEFVSDLYDAITENVEINPKDFCEFYDVNHRSPFDGIYVYIPKIPTVEIPNGVSPRITVRKKKAVSDEYGNITILDSDTIILQGDQVDIPLNKDEYVHSVTVINAMRVLISDFMRIKVTMNLKDAFNNEDNIRFRISANDFTYLSMRDFVYV